MRIEKFTTLFQSALGDAQSLALGRDNQFIEPIHLLKAMLGQDQGAVKPLLLKSGVKIEQLEAELDQAITKLPQVEGAPGEIYPSKDLLRLLNITDKLAQERKDQYILQNYFY